MGKEEIKSLFLDDVDSRKKQIREYIQNLSNSYEDRKEVWENTPDHLKTQDAWILHLPEFEKKYGEISWFDDFYCERYTVVDLTNCLDIVEWDEFKKRDFIAECMALGFHSFNLDW